MSNTDEKVKNPVYDADILQGRADILRAKDVFPPYDQSNQQKNEPEKEPPAKKGWIPEFAEIQNSETFAPKTFSEKNFADEPDVEEKNEKQSVPKFDLGLEILTNQRKNSASRRTRPGLNTRNAIENLVPEITSEEKNALLTEPSEQDIQAVTEFEDTQLQELEVTAEAQIAEEIQKNPEDSFVITDDEINSSKTEIQEQTDKVPVATIEKPQPRSHISERIRPIMTRSEEALINDIVRRDIQRFLKSA